MSERERYTVRRTGHVIPSATITRQQPTPWGLALGPELLVAAIFLGLVMFSSFAWAADALVGWCVVWVALVVRRALRQPADPPPAGRGQAAVSDRR